MKIQKDAGKQRSVRTCVCELSCAVGKWSVLAIVLFSIVSTSGCASIVKGKGRPISFESDPPGATVRIEGKVIGQTPFTETVKGAPIIEFQLAGYQPRFVNPSLEGMWRIEPWYFGNFALLPIGIIGCPIGLCVDAYSDHMVVLKSPFRTSLYPSSTSAPSQPSGLYNTPTLSPTTPVVSLPPPSAVNSAADRLKALKELKNQGVLSDTEYETKKAELIKEL